ncbi:MAG: translocation/assembly module TamB domain-containing protein [Lentimicrobium sp.]|nr:translocation/assembly module TamB domain-containing protein [Lentimicrobium sp.]
MTLLLLLVTLTGLYGLFRSSYVQSRVARMAAAYLSDELHTRVVVSGLDISWFMKFKLEGVAIDDQRGNPVLDAEAIKINIGKLSLRRKFIGIYNIELNNAHIRMVRYAEDSLMNYAFITDYFAGPDTASSQKPFLPWELGFSGITVKNSSFLYNNQTTAKKEAGLDYDHLMLSGLNLSVRKLVIKNDSLSARIHQLSFQEQSGFILKDFSTFLKVSSDSIVANKLHIITEGSDISMDLKFSHRNFGAYQHFTDSVLMQSDIKNSKILLSDIGYFAPELSQIHETVEIDGQVRGTVSSLTIKKLKLYILRNTWFEGSVSMNGLPDFNETFIDIRVKDFQSNYYDLTAIRLPGNKPLIIPEQIKNLGNIRIRGFFTGFITDFVSSATFTTETGKINTDLSLKSQPNRALAAEGHLDLKDWYLGRSLNASEYLGALNLNAEINGIFYQDSININLNAHSDKLQFKGNEFNDISLNGQLQNREFNGRLNINDELVKLEFDGLLDFSGKLPLFNFRADLTDARLSQLNLWNRDTSSMISTHMDLNFSGTNIDNILGSLKFLNTVYYEKGEHYPVEQVLLSIRQTIPEIKTIRLQSDFADAEVTGDYAFTDFYSSVINILNTYLPSYRPAEVKMLQLSRAQKFDYSLRVKDVNDITHLFIPDLELKSETLLFGNFNSANSIVNLKGDASLIIYQGIKIYDWYVQAQNAGTELVLNTGASSIIIKEGVESEDIPELGLDQFKIRTTLEGDSITYAVTWKDTETGNKNSGKISGNLHFEQPPVINVRVDPTTIRINDSSFAIRQQGKLTIDSTAINVEGLEIAGLDQQLKIKGKISEKADDKISLFFDDLNVSNVDLLLKPDGLDFDGSLDGSLNLSDAYKTRKLTANLMVKQFAFNKQTLGDAQILAQWNDEKAGIDLDLNIIYQGNIARHIPFRASGTIFTSSEAKNNYNLNIETRNYNLSTLNPFVSSFASNLKGYASGFFTMTGKFDKPVFEGYLDLIRTEMKIDYLNVTYSLADRVKIEPEMISASNITINDSLGNTATGSFKLRHRYFVKPEIELNINADGIAGLNTNFKQNEVFYGSAFGSGHVSIKGPFDDLLMNIRVRSEKNTKIFIPINLDIQATESEYIRFVNPGQTTHGVLPFEPETSGIDLDMFLDVTPDASIQLFLPENIGNIRGVGNGNLQLRVTKDGDVLMFGQYIITQGTFLFTLQNILNRVFTISPGGKITFRGSPYEADINVNAVYKVRAALKGIPELAGIEEYEGRTIPVECIIQLRNNLYNPDIGFSIRLPDAEETLKQRVFSAIDTTNEVAMTQQMVSLLLLKSFSFSGNPSLAGSVGSSSIEVIANQLSNMLSQISDDVDIGVNYRSGDALSTEALEVALSTHLFEDRVTIDGSFGMMNTGTTQNTSNIVGDVTIDVKITRDGRFRIKAFNKSNNPFEITSFNTPYKQGIGIYYRYEFDRFNEIFRRKRKKNK